MKQQPSPQVAAAPRPTIPAVFRHPVLWVAIVLVALTALWGAINAPEGLITEIAIYTLYGAAVNLLVGYTGLVPFGASVFFGCASYAVAISLLRGLPNEAVALVLLLRPRGLLGERWERFE